MSFLNPTAIAIAAGLTIPPLVALYFLKLKRVIKPVPTTLLWKRSVEDLQVNSPFQRLRSSLLLLLQLLVLILAAIALGKPMFQTVDAFEGSVVILIDRSASMNVVEADGLTRLEKAKEEAKRCVENLDDDARAMVIMFSDDAQVVSPFDTRKKTVQRRIDSIEPTEGRSSLDEAVKLAEAYAKINITTDDPGSSLAPAPTQAPATVFLITDGRIERTDKVAVEHFEKLQLRVIGQRSDNVGILTMDARRHYERPEILEVTATIANFGPEPVALDAVLSVEGQSVDVQTVRLRAAAAVPTPSGGVGSGLSAANVEPEAGSVRVIAFDEIEYEGSGVVEVSLRVDDALAIDNRAWTLIESPRHLRVLLVVDDDNPSLANALRSLPLTLMTMTPEEYESADDEVILAGDRSAFDVVMIDRHATDRLPPGNYFFWGSVPKIEGVAVGETIDDEIIFNWDDLHPILRHVSVETLYVVEWLRLTLPPEAVSLIDGQTSPVLSYLARGPSQFLICAFSLVIDDPVRGRLRNTHWAASADFLMFIGHTVEFLGSSVATRGRRSIQPGEPVTLPLAAPVSSVSVTRPDGKQDEVAAAGRQRIHYAHTQNVGVYRMEPGVEGRDRFAVNLFSAAESRVEPAAELTVGGLDVAAQAGSMEISEPAWPYLLLGVLLLLVLEWIVYNRRVFV